jgi:hypothetical protein
MVTIKDGGLKSFLETFFGQGWENIVRRWTREKLNSEEDRIGDVLRRLRPFLKGGWASATAAGLAVAFVKEIPGIPEEFRNGLMGAVSHFVEAVGEASAQSMPDEEFEAKVKESVVAGRRHKDVPITDGAGKALRWQGKRFLHRPKLDEKGKIALDANDNPMSDCPIWMEDLDQWSHDHRPTTVQKKVPTGKRRKDDSEIFEFKDEKVEPEAPPIEIGSLYAYLKAMPEGPCRYCYGGMVPEEEPKEEEPAHEPHGLKDTFGEHAPAFFVAVNATIAGMGAGKLFSIDQIQDSKTVDADVMKAFIDENYPRIVDGKVPKEVVEQLETLVPLFGKEELTPMNGAGKLWKTAQELLGESPKENERPILQAYGYKLVDVMAAAKRSYNELPKNADERKEHAHVLKAVHVSDLPRLKAKAEEMWPWLKDDRMTAEQFKDWSAFVKTSVAAMELDAERKNTVLHEWGRKLLSLMRTLKNWGLGFGVTLVAGWVLLGILPVVGMPMIAVSLAALTVLSLGLLLPEWVLSIGDLFFPKQNQSDEAVAAVRYKFAGAMGIMLLYAAAAYLFQASFVLCLVLFSASIILPIAVSAMLKLGGAHFALLRSQALSGLVLSALVGAIPVALILAVLIDRNPGQTESIVRIVAEILIGGAFAYGAWKVLTLCVHMGKENEHGMAGMALGLVAALLIAVIGVKTVVTVGSKDFSGLADVVGAKARTVVSEANPFGDASAALEKAKERARALKNGEPVPTPIPVPASPVDAGQGSEVAQGTPDAGPTQPKKVTKAEAKREIAADKKLLTKEYGSIRPLDQVRREYDEQRLRLNALNAKFEDKEAMTQDPEYKEVVFKMGQLDGEKRLLEEIAKDEEIVNGKAPTTSSPRPIASKEELSDGTRAFCLTLKPLARARVPTCKGV